MIFLKYEHINEGNEVQGFVFYYPDEGKCFLLESELDQNEDKNNELKDQMSEFEQIIC
jgi:hypothetical protein